MNQYIPSHPAPQRGSIARVRALFFDIDGTLLRSRGAHLAFNAAVEAVFGLAVDLRHIRADGKTDPEIVRELLAASGGEAGSGLALARGHLARFERELAARWRRCLARGEVSFVVLPGVAPLLASLAAREDVALGVVTGNLRASALVKLSAVGLDRHFLAGAFGGDAPARDGLPELARRRLERLLGVRLEPAGCTVIGDTPADHRAARAAGMRSVLVASGRYSVAELGAVGAELVLPDLADWEGALEALCAT